MATPYDSAIEMFGLPRFGVGAAPFPQREDPTTAARRRFLEGGAPAQQDPDAFVQERAAQTDDPFGVMAEVENLRREREEQGFISDIARLSPGATDYNQSIMGLIQENPRIAQSRGALELIDIQRKLAPEVKDYSGQFRDPVYRQAYQRRIASGANPDIAYQDTLREADNEEMAIKLISAGIPIERHGDLMEGGAFDRRKVAQAIVSAKPRQGYDLPLSGDAKTEFESIVQEMAAARTGRAEPTDEEKMQFLPARANNTWSEQEWADAYQKALPVAQRRAANEAQNRMNLFQQTYGDYYRLPQGLPMDPVASRAPSGTALPAPATPVSPAAQTAPQAVPVQISVPVPVPAPQSPSLPKDTEAEKLWGQYLELENTMRVDADSTNPADREADRELRGEMSKVQRDIMQRLKIPDTTEGRKLFQQVWQGRKNSLGKQTDSRGQFLAQPLQKTGATGNTWVIRPA